MKLDITEVDSRLKQRPPFQMIERVTELEPGKYAEGVKAVSVNEPYFAGHFPQFPIMPGVLIVETAAQLCSLVIEGEQDDQSVYVLLRVKDFKFVRPVTPGELLTVKVRLEKRIAGAFEFSAEVFSDGDLKSKGVLLFSEMKKSDIYSK